MIPRYRKRNAATPTDPLGFPVLNTADRVYELKGSRPSCVCMLVGAEASLSYAETLSQKTNKTSTLKKGTECRGE